MQKLLSRPIEFLTLVDPEKIPLAQEMLCSQSNEDGMIFDLEEKYGEIFNGKVNGQDVNATSDYKIPTDTVYIN